MSKSRIFQGSTTLTSGLLPLTSVTAASQPNMIVSIVNPSQQAAMARIVVYESRSGSKVNRLDVTVDVPPMDSSSSGALSLLGLESRAIEVVVTLSSPLLQPSVTLINTYTADETQDILLYVSTNDFVKIA